MSETPSLDPQRTVDHATPAVTPPLDSASAPGPSQPTTVPRPSVPPPGAPTIAGYVVTGEIARGGMGRVFVGRDLALDREVAIKTLLPGADPERFVTEARLSARLPHPGIPPVHQLGALADGTPFLAMKLIRGRTLAELLKQRASPAEGLPRFLQAFEQIAQAVGFAHSREIIHRDLKPLNIMVGEFGEVQVMDWGLARRLSEASGGRQPPDDCLNQGADAPRSPVAHTVAGAVLGTPGYMAPEQARGETVDARADVFALGAILAAILTGQPAFVGTNRLQLVQMAAQGNLSGARDRLTACGADSDLVGLALRCLESNPERRPADGREVAALVAAYRAGVESRLRRAETDRAAAEAKAAEQRKRRRVQLALVTSFALLLLGGGAFVWRQAEQERLARERQGRNADAITALLDQAEAALRGDDAHRAAVALEAADRRMADGGAELLAARLAHLRSDLALLNELDVIDRFRWTWTGNSFPTAAAVADRLRDTLARFRLDPEAVPLDEVKRAVTTPAVRDRLVTALDYLLWARRSEAVRAALQAADPDARRDPVRDALQEGNPARVRALLASSGMDNFSPGLLAVLALDPDILHARERDRLAAVAVRHPRHLGLLMALGNSYTGTHADGIEQCIRWYQAAIAAAPDNSSAYSNLGAVLLKVRDVAGSEAACRKAIQLEPRSAAAHHNLGNALLRRGDMPGALAAQREAIRLDPQDALAHTSQAATLQKLGKLAEAEAACREAIRLAPQLASAHGNLGIILLDRNEPAGAEASLREALRLDPTCPTAHLGLGNLLVDRKDWPGAEAKYRETIRLDPWHADAHFNLGVVLRERKDLAGAEAAHRKAIRLEPTHAPAHNGLGNALRDQRSFPDAIAAFREAIRLRPTFDFAHNNLGIAYAIQGDFDVAIQSFEEALRLDPNNAGAKTNLALARSLKAKKTLRLLDVLAGKAEPRSPAEACELAYMASRPAHRHFAASVKLYAAAFAADPRLADDLKAGHRYYAACSAARAAGGEGVDAPADAPGRAALRAKALAWLEADLAAYRKELASPAPVAHARTARRLTYWLDDADLAALRSGKARGDMAPAEHRQWDEFWAAVHAVRDQAQAFAERQ